jgi:transposase
MLDDIVGRVVHDHLDNLDLSGVTRIRVDETSAKKRHRYITVVTDVDTGKIVFITKGKDSKTMEEFACWLSAHGGNPKDIVLMASDFGDSFIKGAREHLPNARNVYDPSHLVQLGNQKLDKDRSKEQVNGQRLKSIRYALLKNTENLSEEESDLVTDISKDNSVTSLSYQMNMSLRESLELDDPDLARMYLGMWVDWVDREGSKNFKALSKTVRKYMDGIILALSSGVNNGYQESLNGRIQFSKRLTNGYHKEERLVRMLFFRDSLRGHPS